MFKSDSFSQKPRRVSIGELDEISGLGGGRPTLPPGKKQAASNDFANKNHD